jgi:NifU-like protein involved in Fe-S cluster formation
MYAEATKDHFLHPRNATPLEGADGVGSAGKPGEGNFMIISIRLEGDAIAAASFQTYGCPAAIACGSCATELATGLSPAEAAAVTPEELDRHLGGLPLGRSHCASLAVAALRAAVTDAAGRGAFDR